MEPHFFHHPDDPALRQVHEEIRQTIQNATGTLSIEMDDGLIRQAENVLASIGWTIEEAIVLFLFWCISCPERLTVWAKKHGTEDKMSISTSGVMTLPKDVLDTYAETCGNEADIAGG